MKKLAMIGVMLCGALGWSAVASGQVYMEWVLVGDEGNQPDFRYIPRQCSDTRTKECEEDADCPGECDEGTCTEPPYEECSGDDECPSVETCLPRQHCSDDPYPPCEDDEYCQQVGAGTCEVTTKCCSVSTWELCRDYRDCPDGETCEEHPGYGAVDDEYLIGKYEVTNRQYRAFLNAVARYGDEHQLWKGKMEDTFGGIARTGSGTELDPWIYRPKGGDGNWETRPVNFVNVSRTLRFANWMHNGQPTGAQGVGTTETGAYLLTGYADCPVVDNDCAKPFPECCAPEEGDNPRCPGAKVWLPSEDEWYKAAYYDPDKLGGAGYWDYATRRNTIPKSEPPAGTDLVYGSANYPEGVGEAINCQLWPEHCAVGLPYYSTPVGAYTAKPSTSYYGTFDQNGNLSEWLETRYSCSPPTSKGHRVFRGGDWVTATPPLLHASKRQGFTESDTDGAARDGFRLAAAYPGKGACCLPGGTCEDDYAESQCDNDSGVYRGHWTNCLGGDACEVKRPMGEPCGIVCDDTVPCVTNAHCLEESHCVPPPDGEIDNGTCYAPKTRYISIARHPEQMPSTARRVRLSNDTSLGWVGEPSFETPGQEPGGLWVANVVGAVHYETVWPGVLHVMGCEIAHANLCDGGTHCMPNDCPGTETCEHFSYEIQAIVQGDDTGEEDNYSEVLELHTNTTWGDTVSTCNEDGCKPADGVPGLADISAAIAYFQGNHVAPLTWLDIAPSLEDALPDQVVGLGDIMAATAGFEGDPYPGDGPLNCP